MDTPQFQGKDAYQFLVSCHGGLQSVRLVDSHGVDFTVLQMRDPVKQWWRSFIDSRPVGSPPMTWATFAQAFLDRFVA